jgi:hypothetical protein
MAASTVTTLAIFKQLLTNAVNADASLDDTTRASMLARIADMTSDVALLLDFSNVSSVAGQVSLDELNRSIEVATGATGNNRVIWNQMTFAVPVDISGSRGERGFLPGHVGSSGNSPVDSADISLEYRFGATDPWKKFTRNSLLEDVTTVQFAAAIADQGADAALPTLNLIAEQK